MFMKGLWSKYALVNYEAKLNCNLVSCFKIHPHPLVISKLTLVLVMCRWHCPDGPTPADVFPCCLQALNVLPATPHKPWVCSENPLHLRTVTVLLSIKSLREPGASSVIQLGLFPTHGPQRGLGALLVNEPSWESVTCLYVSGNNLLTRLKLCS